MLMDQGEVEKLAGTRQVAKLAGTILVETRQAGTEHRMRARRTRALQRKLGAAFEVEAGWEDAGPDDTAPLELGTPEADDPGAEELTEAPEEDGAAPLELGYTGTDALELNPPEDAGTEALELGTPDEDTAAPLELGKLDCEEEIPLLDSDAE
ncbi:hypothetical protein LTR09_007069 [Extremus antarcticus]|uniref:Uncharacterized protein n=1 Tax=Extremus antarcticus TaxID=702011 RepID=A0AAJ0GD72_9PEZI|nr:hypothetical protein LTR09_007069 [Extremus antarcticus]